MARYVLNPGRRTGIPKLVRRQATLRVRAPIETTLPYQFCRSQAVATSPPPRLQPGSSIHGRLSPSQTANAARVASRWLVTRTMRSPLRASGAVAQPESASGQRSAASASIAASEIISPPILANRLARPLMAMKPSGVDGDDIAGIVPTVGRTFKHSGVLRAQISEHHVGPTHISRPPASIPATGSSRTSMPGRMRPTVPNLLNIGVLSASTGAVSVTP